MQSPQHFRESSDRSARLHQITGQHNDFGLRRQQLINRLMCVCETVAMTKMQITQLANRQTIQPRWQVLKRQVFHRQPDPPGFNGKGIARTHCTCARQRERDR
jgi:hypothetical protein